jgi:hypothetical protein
LLGEVLTNEEEKAIARADLLEISQRMTELRDMANWWRMLSPIKRQEFQLFQGDVVVYRNVLLTD